MCELTLADADSIELVGFYDGGAKQDWSEPAEHLTIGRWTNYGNDRLYINDGIAKCDKYDLYVDLQTHEVVSDNDAKHTGGSVEINGDEAVITIEESGSVEHVITLQLEGEGFETEPEPRTIDVSETTSAVTESATEPTKVTDGGEDASDVVSDSQIDSRIQQHDDPGHEDAATVERVRDVLATLQRDLANHISEYDDTLDVAHEDQETIVYIDPDGHELEYALDEAGVDDEIMRTIVDGLFHDLARERCDLDWPADYPLVVRKPSEFRAAEQHALRSLGRTIGAVDSPKPTTKGVDYWATHIHDLGYAEWARECGGRDRSNVRSNALEAKNNWQG